MFFQDSWCFSVFKFNGFKDKPFCRKTKILSRKKPACTASTQFTEHLTPAFLYRACMFRRKHLDVFLKFVQKIKSFVQIFRHSCRRKIRCRTTNFGKRHGTEPQRWSDAFRHVQSSLSSLFRTSDKSTSCPTSRAMEVTPLSINPQG